MDFVLIGGVAFLASILTFFSGFGLGTLLTPAFLVFFPVEKAILLTGIVHLLNNLFKLILVGKQINYDVLLRFGLPGILGAYFGSSYLMTLTGLDPVFSYKLSGQNFYVSPVNLIIAFLMIFFVAIELIPSMKHHSFSKKYLIPGGILSGFFGGLSGHQGALRSMFLIKLKLSKTSFIATGVAIACLIDFMRLGVYFKSFNWNHITDNWSVLVIGVLCAFLGALLGRKLLTKIKLEVVQNIVSFTICILAIGLATGILD